MNYSSLLLSRTKMVRLLLSCYWYGSSCASFKVSYAELIVFSCYAYAAAISCWYYVACWPRVVRKLAASWGIFSAVVNLQFLFVCIACCCLWWWWWWWWRWRWRRCAVRTVHMTVCLSFKCRFVYHSTLVISSKRNMLKQVWAELLFFF